MVAGYIVKYVSILTSYMIFVYYIKHNLVGIFQRRGYGLSFTADAQEEPYVQCIHHTLGDEHCNCAVQNVFTLKRWILKNNSLESTSDSFYVNTGDDNVFYEVDYD